MRVAWESSSASRGESSLNPRLLAPRTPQAPGISQISFVAQQTTAVQHPLFLFLPNTHEETRTVSGDFISYCATLFPNNFFLTLSSSFLLHSLLNFSFHLLLLPSILLHSVLYNELSLVSNLIEYSITKLQLEEGEFSLTRFIYHQFYIYFIFLLHFLFFSLTSSLVLN